MEKQRKWLREKANKVKECRSKYLIAVLENPSDIKNIWAVIRNINALWVEKLYIVDSKWKLPKDWESIRWKRILMATSVSAVKWTFVKTFSSTQECIEHLKSKWFVSIVTSPHVKWKVNVSLPEWNYTQSKLAVWFGNESVWISDLAIEESIACISIPMCGIIESFNLAVSTWIVLYEIVKQRREYLKTHKNKRRKEPLIIKEK